MNKYSKQPFLTIAPNDELPELLRETFEFYNKSNKKELKKTTTQAEKDILYECVFKMRYIYGGMIYHRYLSLNRQYYVRVAYISLANINFPFLAIKIHLTYISL